MQKSGLFNPDSVGKSAVIILTHSERFTTIYYIFKITVCILVECVEVMESGLCCKNIVQFLMIWYNDINKTIGGGVAWN